MQTHRIFFSINYILHTKTGLACARPAYYEVQPATRVEREGRIFMRVILKNEIQGLRSPRNRSLLDVSKDFEDKRNAEVRL